MQWKLQTENHVLAAIRAEVAKCVQIKRQQELSALPPGTTATATNLPPDPEELIKQYEKSQEEWERLQAEKELPAIEDTVDCLTTEMPKPKVLIEGVLHQGSKMIIGSGSKSFKTWTLLDLAMSVACGVPWLGMDTSEGKVLFLNLELKPASIKSRIEPSRRPAA